jgi:hypothetical protein
MRIRFYDTEVRMLLSDYLNKLFPNLEETIEPDHFIAGTDESDYPHFSIDLELNELGWSFSKKK